jgi:uncharacterized SAM-binding protein YcdF (DUF218 family)
MGRAFKFAAFGLMGIAALLIILVLSLGWFIAPSDALQKSDAIVVVSGGDTVKRTEEGIRLWQAGYAPTLVMAGAAADQGTSNAAVMRRQAVVAGVPENRILVEEKSTNTSENASFLKPVLDGANVKSMIVVTSPYHARRVKVNFQKTFGKGYEVRIHPALDTRWRRSSWWQDRETIHLTWDEFRKTFYTAIWHP